MDGDASAESVSAGSQGEKNGVLAGALITAVSGTRVSAFPEFSDALGALKAAKKATVDLTISRGAGTAMRPSSLRDSFDSSIRDSVMTTMTEESDVV